MILIALKRAEEYPIVSTDRRRDPIRLSTQQKRKLKPRIPAQTHTQTDTERVGLLLSPL